MRDVMRLLKIMLKAGGKQGVPQGGVITPRTQKVTLALHPRFAVGGRLGSGRRRSRVRRDRVPDRDGVIVHQDFFDNEADNLLPIGDLQ